MVGTIFKEIDILNAYVDNELKEELSHKLHVDGMHVLDTILYGEVDEI